jgi:spectinomycin phosphotransferase
MNRVSLRYVPLGFGSHHWIATTVDGQRWFITVDDIRAGHLGTCDEKSFEILTTAFQTAAALRDFANLPFVIAPIADMTGEVIHRLSEHYAMAVFPFLDMEPTEFGEFRQQEDRNQAMRLIGQVHNATSRLSVKALRRDTLVVPNRADLMVALESLDVTWSAGPYSDPARLLLREHADAVMKKLRRFDEMAASVVRDTSGWVISHGEPHAGNAVRTRAGNLVFVDWDTVAYAPRERDLWMLVNETTPDWAAYRNETEVTSLSDSAMDTYRLHWALSEIAIFVSWFLRPHERTEDMETAWVSLRKYLTD